MPKYLTIKVLKKHIKEGETMDGDSCPIALACNASTRHWFIEKNTIQDKDNFYSLVAKLPKKAQIFIKRFDDGMLVKPFSFRVKLED